jgi:hypothetical protein
VFAKAPKNSPKMFEEARIRSALGLGGRSSKGGTLWTGWLKIPFQSSRAEERPPQRPYRGGLTNKNDNLGPCGPNCKGHALRAHPVFERKSSKKTSPEPKRSEKLENALLWGSGRSSQQSTLGPGWLKRPFQPKRSTKTRKRSAGAEERPPKGTVLWRDWPIGEASEKKKIR